MTSCPAPELLIAFDRSEVSPEERRSIETHLTSCPRCRDDRQLLEALREGMARHGVATRLGDGSACPDEMGIARFAEGRLPPAERDEMARHLLRCGHCLTLLDAALLEVTAAEARAGAVAASPGADPSVTGWIRTHLAPRKLLQAMVPAIAAALVLVAVISPGLQSPTDVTGLATIEVLPVRHVRGGTDPQGFDSIYRKALLDYDAGDYAAAAPALARAHALEPERSEPSLYLGSALLIEGDPATAREVLEPLSRREVGEAYPHVIEEARWLLAQACLLLNDRSCARDALRAVEALDGRRQTAARTLLGELRAAD